MSAPVVATSRFDTTTAERAVSNRIATSNQLPRPSSDQWGIVGEIKVPLGDNADVIYIGSYREYAATEAYDSAFSGLDIFNVLPASDLDIETMTHELRVQGDVWDGRLSWMVGGYYSKEDIAQTVNFGLGQDYGELIGALFTAAGAGGFGANPLTFLTDSNIFPNSPLNVPGGIDPSAITVSNAYTQNSKSWSLFTHNVLEVADGLKLTLGLRWSDESKRGGFTQPAVNNPLCPAIVGTIAAGNVPAPLINNVFGTGCFAFTAPADLASSAVFPSPRSYNSRFNDEELIYTGKVSYEFASPVTIYASFTHGYKSGGFNLDSTAATLANAAAVAGGATPVFLDPRFASEEVDAYEIGLKGKFIDDAVTLNMALFLEEFSNFQVLEFTGAQFQTFNVPKAESKGVEIETVIRPSENLTFNAALTYTDARYPDDCATTADALRVQNLCGSALSNAPKWVGIAGGTYEREIGDSLKFFLNAQVRMESDRRTSTQPSTPPTTQAQLGNTPLLPFDVQDGTAKINMRAGLGDIDDSWGIEAWVTNLTNQVTRSVTFNTVLRTGSRSTFIQEPRMYGLTVRGKF
jgi:outer membrane receptor protein involved in Fe transport